MVVLQIHHSALDAGAVLVLNLAVDDSLRGTASLSGDRTRRERSEGKYKHGGDSSDRRHDTSIRAQVKPTEDISPRHSRSDLNAGRWNVRLPPQASSSSSSS